MKTPLLSILVTLLLASAATAGGYHCKLKINDLQVTADKTYELKVEKIEADRKLYKDQLGEWEMVKEPIGKEFTIIFKPKEFDESSLKCLNFMIHAFKEDKIVEFGFGDTAIKADEDGRFISSALTTWHTNRLGEPCVHGS